MILRRGRFAVLPAVCLLFLVVFATLAPAQDPPPAAGINQHFIDGVKLVQDRMHQEAVAEFNAALADDPELEPAWHYLGLSQYFLGNYQEALTALHKASDLAPSRPGTRLYIGRIYELLGAYDEAVGVYQEELRVNVGKDTSDAYNALARGQYLAGEYRQAIEMAYQAELRDPNYVEALYNRGRAETARENYKEAVKQFQAAKEVLEKWTYLKIRLQRLTEEVRSDPEITEEKVSQDYHRAEEFATDLGLWPELNKALGRAQLRYGRFADARNSFRASMEPSQRGNPDDPEAQTLIGAAYFEEAKDVLLNQELLFFAVKTFGAAARELQATLEASPDFPPALNALGEVYLLQAATYDDDPGRGIVSHTFGEAEDMFRQALAQDPQFVDAMANLSRAYIGQAKFDDAIRQLEQALALAPARADLHAELARAYVGIEEYVYAREEAAEAIRLDRDNVVAWNSSGLASYYQGDLADAVESYHRAIEADPSQHQSHTNLGLAYFQMRSWNLARRRFDKALELMPEATITNTAIQRSYLLYLTAMTYSNTGAHDRAVAKLNEALSIDTGYFEALRQLARDYTAMRNYVAARGALRRAAQWSPGVIEHAQVLAQLGGVLETAGKPHEALAAYSEAITKDPQNYEAQQGFDRLQAF